MKLNLNNVLVCLAIALTLQGVNIAYANPVDESERSQGPQENLVKQSITSIQANVSTETPETKGDPQLNQPVYLTDFSPLPMASHPVPVANSYSNTPINVPIEHRINIENLDASKLDSTKNTSIPNRKNIKLSTVPARIVASGAGAVVGGVGGAALAVAGVAGMPIIVPLGYMLAGPEESKVKLGLTFAAMPVVLPIIGPLCGIQLGAVEGWHALDGDK